MSGRDEHIASSCEPCARGMVYVGKGEHITKELKNNLILKVILKEMQFI